jgi:hypothetical protein
MSKYKSEFLRVEKKYLLNEQQCQAILNVISEHMTEEKYGEHTISNIYYDTTNFQLIRASIEKPLYKEKLRLRAYGSVTEESNVFVEIKKKFKGIVYKRREALTLENAKQFLNEKNRHPGEIQVLREADWMLNLYNLKPAAAISYTRIAFFGNDDPDFRLTIDKNIKGRLTNLELKEGTFGDEIINHDQRLMENKTTGGMPIWMCDLLSEFKIYPTSFSKYGKFYKNNVLNAKSIKNIKTNYLIEKEMVKSA